MRKKSHFYFFKQKTKNRTSSSGEVKPKQDVEQRSTSTGCKNLLSVGLRSNEAEMWSRMMRKSLESTLRKAVLTMTTMCTLSGLSSTLSTSSSSSSSSSTAQRALWMTDDKPANTLRRSYDIKIGLSKLLDRKSYDLLLKCSGAYVAHNCTNVNKHGVVTCDKSDDLPDWVIKGMHELINCKFPY